MSGGASVLKAGDTDVITFTFSEAVAGFDAKDVKVTGGTLGVISKTDATHYTATFTPNVTDTLSASVSVAASGTAPSLWTDLAGNAGTASNTFGITGDTKAATVTSIVATPTSTALKTNDHVTFTLTTSEAVTVDPNVVLKLNDGATASYSSGSGSTTLAFDYLVGPETTKDLLVTGIDQSLGLITGADGNTVSATLAFDTKDVINVFSWKGGVGAFEDSTKWSVASAPGIGSTALITAAGTYTVSSNTADHSVAILNTAATATLALDNHKFDVTSGGTNAGTITLADGAALDFGGTFTNTGKITLTDDDSNVIGHVGSHGTLINAGPGISGAGTIVDDNLTIDNQSKGIINATGTEALTIDVGTFTNEGKLQATGTGGLVIENTTITGTASSSLATITSVTGHAHIDLDNVTISGGTVTVVANSTLDTFNDHASTITVTKLTNAGTFAADHGDLTVNGAVTNTGVLAAAHGSHLDITGAVTGAGTATIASGGILEFGGASSAKVTFLDATGTLQLDHATTTVSKFTGTISGFALGTDIDLGAINYTTGNAQLVSFVENATHTSGILTVKDLTHTETLTFIGDHTLADFTTLQDVNHHVDLLHV